MKEILTKENFNKFLQLKKEIDGLLMSYLAIEKGIICDDVYWRVFGSSYPSFHLKYEDENCKEQSICVSFDDVKKALMKKYVS